MAQSVVEQAIRAVGLLVAFGAAVGLLSAVVLYALLLWAAS